MVGENINGPSLIVVPDWVADRLGRYYLYFAHHRGRYIRLAYADDLRGPWKVHEGKVLRVGQVPRGKKHVASPDLHVDADTKKIRMYFHSPCVDLPGQHTFVAESRNGLSFTSRTDPVGTFYFRAWKKHGFWWALGKALLYRSPDGLTSFEVGQFVYGPPDQPTNQRVEGSIRHTAVCQFEGNTFVFYTRLGDRPERILCGILDDSNPDNWRNWQLRGEVEVLRPDTDYEGAGLPLTPSAPGAAHQSQNALRDPCFFEEDGHSYLLYAVAGERGIALAEIDMRRLARKFLSHAK
ncbi:MAG: hypothetical protein R3D80_13130 [Paracoccaceae bacterium]